MSMSDYAIKTRYIRGIVITQRMCEIIAMLAPVLVSPPYAAGKTIVFNPSGVAYANGGKLKKIANNTYIITPYNVDVMGDLLDELENNGMFF